MGMMRDTSLYTSRPPTPAFHLAMVLRSGPNDTAPPAVHANFMITKILHI